MRELWHDLLEWLGYGHTVDSLVEPLNTIVERLKRHQERHFQREAEHVAKARSLNDAAKASFVTAERAGVVASKIKALVEA